MLQLLEDFWSGNLKKNGSDFIRFEFLGPSPFHAECYIQEFNENVKDVISPDCHFHALRRQCLAYDEILLYYNPVLFENSDEALYYIKGQIAEELGVFYNITAFGNLQMNYWHDIEQDIKRLIQIQKKTGLKGIFQKLFYRSNIIHYILIALAEFKSVEIFYEHEIKNSITGLEYLKSMSCFQQFISERLAERYDYPIAEYSKLLDFFESRRVKSIEIITILIAALIGGGIGAFLTIFFTSP